jgi:peptidoglycan/xylan/chitin deacetylase (PgdA/CDA1 family)
MSSSTLTTVMYHYVRNFPETKYSRLKGMLLDDFRRQIQCLMNTYEMATLESAYAFLSGAYKPSRPLCLLTFDDGLKEHYTDITPLLAEHDISGIFFVVSGCLEEQTVASVHMNHLLMASLEWVTYQTEFLQALNLEDPERAFGESVDSATAARTYPWDTSEVAQFKYFFNFALSAPARDRAVRILFERHLGAESAASQELYLSWDEACEMQNAGMLIGGHTHRHQALATLTEADLLEDLANCKRLLDERLLPQPMWPFSYPYGKRDSFTDSAVRELQRLSFDCAFSTEPGADMPGSDLFCIRRIDCKVAPPYQAGRAA